jgi:hypothetical protein
VWITILAVYCASWAAIGVWAWNTPSRPPDVSTVDVLTGVGTCMAPALATIVLLAVLLTRRRRKDRQWRKAMPAMAEVWQEAWFCGRCGGAFLDSPTMPPELSRRLVAPPNFRDIVFLAGLADQPGARRTDTA